jgi:hypothetical protein
MKIRAGYRIAYDCLQPTPMILTLSVHPSRRSDLITADRLTVHPFVPVTEYCDGFGNICHVIRAPQGRITLSSSFLINDSGAADDAKRMSARPRSTHMWRDAACAGTSPISPSRFAAA